MTIRSLRRMLFLLRLAGIVRRPAAAHPGTAIAVASDGRATVLATRRSR